MHDSYSGALRSAAIGALLLTVTTASSAQDPEADSTPPLLRSHTFTIEPLTAPTAACFDEDGNLFVVESWANRIRALSPTGATLRSWGRPGSAASEFHDPHGIAYHGGKLFVVDRGNGRVQVFRRDGTHGAGWGRRGRGPGELLDPRGVAVDAARVYVADTGNHRVQVFDHDGKALASYGAYGVHGTAPGGLLGPEGVAVDDSGRIFIADTGNHRIVTLSAAGEPLATWSSRGTAPGLLSAPRGLHYHRGHLYVADSENHRIQVFTGDGEFVGGWGLHTVRPHEGAGRLHYPCAVAIARGGEVAAVCEAFENRCQLFRHDPLAPPDPPGLPGGAGPVTSHYGERCSVRGSLLALLEPERGSLSLLDLRRDTPILIHRLGDYGPGFGQFLRPDGVELAAGKHIFVSDPLARSLKVYEHRWDRSTEIAFRPTLSRLVRALQLDEFVTREPSLADLPSLEPCAVRVDRGGDLHLIDPRLGTIVVLSPELEFRRRFGAFGSDRGELRRPTDVAFSTITENIYVVDAGNFRVQAFGEDGSFRFAWGTPGVGPGEFVRPFGIAVATDGSVFVTDSGSHRVQKFDAFGKFVTDWGAGATEIRPAERMGAGALYKPTGIAISFDGRVIVVDHGNHRGQIFDADGKFLGAFGDRIYVSPTRREAPAKEKEAGG